MRTFANSPTPSMSATVQLLLEHRFSSTRVLRFCVAARHGERRAEPALLRVATLVYWYHRTIRTTQTTDGIWNGVPTIQYLNPGGLVMRRHGHQAMTCFTPETATVSLGEGSSPITAWCGCSPFFFFFSSLLIFSDQQDTIQISGCCPLCSGTLWHHNMLEEWAEEHGADQIGTDSTQQVLQSNSLKLHTPDIAYTPVSA